MVIPIKMRVIENVIMLGNLTKEFPAKAWKKIEQNFINQLKEMELTWQSGYPTEQCRTAR